jgi:hypothetical protein
MFLRVNKCKRMNRIFVAFLTALLLLVPISLMGSSVAFAQDLTRTVDGTMNITMQEALSPSASSSNLATTGDPLFFVVLGFIALAIGVLYFALVTKNKQLALTLSMRARRTFLLTLNLSLFLRFQLQLRFQVFGLALTKLLCMQKRRRSQAQLARLLSIKTET